MYLWVELKCRPDLKYVLIVRGFVNANVNRVAPNQNLHRLKKIQLISGKKASAGYVVEREQFRTHIGFSYRIGDLFQDLKSV